MGSNPIPTARNSDISGAIGNSCFTIFYRNSVSPSTADGTGMGIGCGSPFSTDFILDPPKADPNSQRLAGGRDGTMAIVIALS